MLSLYLSLKLLHVVAAAVVAGTGAGIAFFMFMANRAKNPQAIYVTTRHVILADWIFTMPAVVVQAATGIGLMWIRGYSFTAPWFAAVASLFVFVGLCWLPVLCIQYRLRDLAELGIDNEEISPEFKAAMRTWTRLGVPAFAAILVLFYLMVFKPLPMIHS